MPTPNTGTRRSRRTLWTGTVAILAALTLPLTGSVLVSPAAQAGTTATCHAASCHGKDPNLTGCARDARTVKTAYADDLKIELRYSPTCQAAWGRISNGAVEDEVQIQRSDGASFPRTAITSGHDAYTPMVNDAGYTARACGWEYSWINSSACTGWY
ncbi:DUF2690 domain-containing protein [Carbonactinospora thermoautotrophica]|uniref:DUF2690 domain-containing protein n=1 Tax=Carbonactinospora thermoautotrophica TaxID=1469144 RepID=UPI0008308EA9|nr:DUF2690 domain-containing protein [Carbonactinospora thermoautotrophica]MCX9193359.1 DUF2690 domain-containing protein [Carbonactinospora thermoautotrophica]